MLALAVKTKFLKPWMACMQETQDDYRDVVGRATQDAKADAVSCEKKYQNNPRLPLGEF